MKNENWREAKVIKIAELTADVKHFWLQVKDSIFFDFKPGQYVVLDLPIGDFQKDRFRSYSIASPPSTNPVFEIVVMRGNGGNASDYLFNEVKEGSLLRFNGALGSFLLQEKIDNDICFICTGTGIAPVRSMFKHLIDKGTPKKNVFIFFGTQYLKDVMFREELEAIQKSFPHFTYKFVLSKEESTYYKGTKGYVHQLYEKEFANKREADFYLCGWREMVQEACERLKAMGYLTKDIHQEVYE